MSKIELEIKTKITLELTAGEAGALDAIVGYGVESFMRVFKQHMGKYYIEPYEKHMESLFEKCRTLHKSVQEVKNIVATVPKVVKVN